MLVYEPTKQKENTKGGENREKLQEKRQARRFQVNRKDDVMTPVSFLMKNDKKRTRAFNQSRNGALIIDNNSPERFNCRTEVCHLVGLLVHPVPGLQASQHPLLPHTVLLLILFLDPYESETNILSL